MNMLEVALSRWSRVVYSMYSRFEDLKESLHMVSLDSLAGKTIPSGTGIGDSRDVQSVIVSTRARSHKKPGEKGSIDGTAMGSMALSAVGWCVSLMDGKGEEKFLSPPEEDERIGRLMGLVMMDLISNSELSVKEISRRVGFAHVSHFSTAFRRHFDMTPSEGIRRFRGAPAHTKS